MRDEARKGAFNPELFERFVEIIAETQPV